MLSTQFSMRRLVSFVIRPNAASNILYPKHEALSSIVFTGIKLDSSKACLCSLALRKENVKTPANHITILSQNNKQRYGDSSTSIINIQSVEFNPNRCSSSYFQQSLPSATLWKQVTSVSTQGKKRGRAKGIMRIKNLNKGQRLGWGKEKMRFPGLTTTRLSPDREKPTIGKIDESEHQAYIDGVNEIQNKFLSRRKKRKISPLERGWTGSNPSGRKFGAPVSTNPDLMFDKFDSILVEYRNSARMDGKFGRVRGLKLIMVTGNKNGTAGFARAYGAFGRGPAVFQKVLNRAGLRLSTIPRYEDRTVYHDFFTNFGETTITVLQKPLGYGIKAHRLITSVCELIGIKDLYAKIDGSMNYNHILKAFFLGLLRQRTHQELANEMKLHLVEFRKENYNFPKVVASPENGLVRTKEEILPNEILDFQVISFDGNKPLIKPKPRPFYEKLPSWEQRLKKVKPQEHHFQHRIDMRVQHGREQSQYTDVFPECKSLTDYQIEFNTKKKEKNRNSE
jgi:small subunit ribosomal protein S5